MLAEIGLIFSVVFDSVDDRNATLRDGASHDV